MTKHRLPRKNKKALSKNIVFYDMTSMPDNFTTIDVVHLYKTHGILFYNSNNGAAPNVTPLYRKHIILADQNTNLLYIDEKKRFMLMKPTPNFTPDPDFKGNKTGYIGGIDPY